MTALPCTTFWWIFGNCRGAVLRTHSTTMQFIFLLATLFWYSSIGFLAPNRNLIASKTHKHLGRAAAAAPPALLSSVSLQLSPLVGGPRWLKVHVKVLLRDSDDITHAWGFVPLNATAPATLASLLSFKAVPGEIRYQQKPSSISAKPQFSAGTLLLQDSEPIVAQVNNDFCLSYPTDLHLIRNNCWNFALDLVSYLNSREP